MIKIWSLHADFGGESNEFITISYRRHTEPDLVLMVWAKARVGLYSYVLEICSVILVAAAILVLVLIRFQKCSCSFYSVLVLGNNFSVSLMTGNNFSSSFRRLSSVKYHCWMI